MASRKLAAGWDRLTGVAAAFLANRLAVFAVAVLGFAVIAHGPYLNASEPALRLSTGLFSRFDSGWYLGIVGEGYFYPVDGYPNTHFFPLYPAAMMLLGLAGIGPVDAGFLVSNLCLLAACAMLLKLVRLDFDEGVSYRTVLYLLAFPASFFLSAVYAESLFLLCAVASMYFARRGNWPLAGISGFLCALARMPGALIFLPLAIEYLEQRKFSIRGIRPDAGFLLFPLLGLLVFMGYLQLQFGDPIAFIHSTQYWNRNSMDPLVLVSGAGIAKMIIKALFQPDATVHVFPMNIVYVLFSLAAIAAAAASIKFLRRSYAAYCLVFLFAAMSIGRLDAIMRYIAVIFPLFIVLAIAGRRKEADGAILAFSLLLLALFTVMFVNGYKMY